MNNLTEDMLAVQEGVKGTDRRSRGNENHASGIRRSGSSGG